MLYISIYHVCRCHVGCRRRAHASRRCRAHASQQAMGCFTQCLEIFVPCLPLSFMKKQKPSFEIFLADGDTGRIECSAIVFPDGHGHPYSTQSESFDKLKRMYVQSKLKKGSYQLGTADLKCWVKNTPRVYSDLVHLDSDIVGGTIVTIKRKNT